jgi:hypothetical protein
MLLATLKEISQKSRQIAIRLFQLILQIILLQLIQELLSSIAIQVLNSSFSHQLQVIRRIDFAIIAVDRFILIRSPSPYSRSISLFKLNIIRMKKK